MADGVDAARDHEEQRVVLSRATAAP